MKVLMPVLFFLLVSASAQAQRVSTTTGNDLLQLCESKDKFEQAFCIGYVTGITDVEGFDSAIYPERQRSCIAEKATSGQLSDIVVKYLKDHPEERHLQAAILVVKAMGQAFPCKAK